MLGDVLKARVHELKNGLSLKKGPKAFWVILRDIAKDEIIALYPEKVDSDTIVPIYYDILTDNIECIPEDFRRVLPSNSQEKYRVVNRNLFTSNAFHTDGLANQKGIIAYKDTNDVKKGNRVIYQGDERYVNQK